MKAVYIRTSTDDQHPENQINDIETLSGKDYELFQDKQSAWKDNKEREDFERLRKLIIKRRITNLFVWDWDRLFRNRKRLKEFFQFCSLYKCNIHSFRQQFFETFYQIPYPFDEIMQELFLNLLGWMAEDESKKKSDRVRIAFQNHKGKKWGRPSIHTNKKKIVWDLRREGLSIRKIAERTKLSVGKVSGICSEMDNPLLPIKTPLK